MQTKTENLMPKRKVYEEKMKAWQVAPTSKSIENQT